MQPPHEGGFFLRDGPMPHSLAALQEFSTSPWKILWKTGTVSL